MKKYYTPVLVLMIFFTAAAANAQETIQYRKTRYGVEMNCFATGSGFKPGSELYLTVIPDNRKLLSLGLYFSPDQKKLSGFTIQHERSLYRIHGDRIPRIMPFAFYNLIYRKTTMHEILVNKEIEGPMATYASIEHHIGVGANIRLGGGFYLKAETGYGIYLGSIKKPSAPDAITGEISGTNGFGALAKVGFGYYF
jgi:hypothetical protein